MQVAKIGGLEVIDLRDRYPYAPGRSYEQRPLSAISGVVVHHADAREPVEDGSNGPSIALIDGIDRWHKDNNLWPAIGYHFCIDADGTVFWVNGLQLISYHSGPANRYSAGICLLGDYEYSAPPVAMVASLAVLIAALGRELGREIGIYGHKDVMATGCPGAHWSSTRARLRTLVALPPVPQSLRDAAEGYLHALWSLDERTHRGVIAIKQDLQYE